MENNTTVRRTLPPLFPRATESSELSTHQREPSHFVAVDEHREKIGELTYKIHRTGVEREQWRSRATDYENRLNNLQGENSRLISMVNSEQQRRQALESELARQQAAGSMTAIQAETYWQKLDAGLAMLVQQGTTLGQHGNALGQAAQKLEALLEGCDGTCSEATDTPRPSKRLTTESSWAEEGGQTKGF